MIAVIEKGDQNGDHHYIIALKDNETAEIT